MKKIIIITILFASLMIAPITASAVSINFVIAIYSALDEESQNFSFKEQQDKNGVSYWLGTNKLKKCVIGLFGDKDILKSAMAVGYPSTEEDLTMILSNMNGLMYFFTEEKKAADWLLACIRQFAKGETSDPYEDKNITANFYIEDGSLNLELYFNKYFTK